MRANSHLLTTFILPIALLPSTFAATITPLAPSFPANPPTLAPPRATYG
jgi:hypothetical protein